MGGLTVVGLGGSLAAVSTSRAALRVALEGAAHVGAETTLLDLRELGLPMYDPDDDGRLDSAIRRGRVGESSATSRRLALAAARPPAPARRSAP